MNKLQNELKYINVRNTVYKELEGLVSENGYIKVEPDFFEPYEDILRTNTRINPKSMVKIIDPNGEVQLLRPDITTNIIKQLSPYWEENSILKLYYNATTFRQLDKRILQAKQFGVEYIGESSLIAEIEVIKLVLSIFKTFEENFILSLGNQALLDELFSAYSKEDRKQIYKAIIRRDITTYRELINEDENSIINNLFSLNGNIDKIVDVLKTYESSIYKQRYIDFLTQLQNAFTKEELKNITLDLALLTEFDYYCGIVLQGFIKNMSKPILSGGRYDKLTKQYGSIIPAVGISFDVLAYIKEVNNG